MKASLKRQKIDSKYTFDRPITKPEPKIFNTFTGIKPVFSDPTKFKIIYEKTGYGSVLQMDDVAQYVVNLWELVVVNLLMVVRCRHDKDKALVLHSFFPEKESLPQYAAWFGALVSQKIREKTFQ